MPSAQPSAVRRIDNLRDLDDVLAQVGAAFAVSDDEAAKVMRTFTYVRQEARPTDPYSEAYRLAQMRAYAHLSGRATYEARLNEHSAFDVAAAKVCPFPYLTHSSETVGTQLIQMGLIIKQLPLEPRSRIVEFGAGWGNLALHLAQMGHAVTTVDIEPSFGELIRDRARRLGAHVDVIEQDMVEFCPAVPYDAAIFFACFHHCADHLRMLRNLGHIVNADGVLVFAAEPIETFPVPWGIRLDGMSLWSIRRHGWLELGFDTSYFFRTLLRFGWLPERHVLSGCASAEVIVARRARGLYEPHRLSLPPDEECTWGAVGEDYRIAGRQSHLSCAQDGRPLSVEFRLSNLGSVPARVTLGTAGGGRLVDLPVGATRADVTVPVDQWDAEVTIETRAGSVAVHHVRCHLPDAAPPDRAHPVVRVERGEGAAQLASSLDALAHSLQCPRCAALAWRIVEVGSQLALECRACHVSYPWVEGVLHLDRSREDPAVARERNAAATSERDPARGGINEEFDDLSRARGALRDAILALPHGDDSRYYREPGYFANVRLSSPAFDFMANALAPRPGQRLLDLGADLTWSTSHFARQGLRCVALDVNHHLTVARLFEERFGVRYDLVRADMTEVSFIDEAFDIVIGVHALHLARDLPTLAANVARMLAPGGRLGFVEPYCAGEAERETVERARRESGVSERMYLPEEWHQAFTRAGLVLRTHRFADSFAAVYEKRTRTPRTSQGEAGHAPRTAVFDGFLAARLAATMDTLPVVGPGALFEVPLQIQNASPYVWCPASAFCVRASYHLYRTRHTEPSATSGADAQAGTDLQLVSWENLRTPLPAELAAGATFTMRLQIQAPAERGNYVAEVDLVQERIAWLSPRGADRIGVPFVVQ